MIKSTIPGVEIAMMFSNVPLLGRAVGAAAELELAADVGAAVGFEADPTVTVALPFEPQTMIFVALISSFIILEVSLTPA